MMVRNNIQLCGHIINGCGALMVAVGYIVELCFGHLPLAATPTENWTSYERLTLKMVKVLKWLNCSDTAQTSVLLKKKWLKLACDAQY